MDRHIIENIYGHAKRLGWIRTNIDKTDRVLEFGCGTGYMITLPLAKMGYHITGIDTDKKSIDYGRRIFAREGMDPKSLQIANISELDNVFDVIIASEVLEHIPTAELNCVITSIYSKLRPGGSLLITVPNGYGWFEAESFIWNKLQVGSCLEKCGIVFLISGLKQLLFGKKIEPMHPSTLSSSPHLQRFTLRTIQSRLKRHGFDIIDIQGSVLFCGQFSNLLFTGVKPIMQLNKWVGSKFLLIAASFYIAAKKYE